MCVHLFPECWQINKMRARRKAIRDKKAEVHTLAAESPHGIPLGGPYPAMSCVTLGEEPSPHSPCTSESNAWMAQTPVFEQDHLSFR